MAAIVEAELKKELADSAYKNVYLIYGEESYLKQHYVNLLKKKLVKPEFEGFNYHSFEEKNASLDQILSAAESLPMMDDYTCVVAHDYPLDKLADGERKLLKSFLEDLPESCVLVFWMDHIAVDPKNSKWKTLLGYFTKNGHSVNLGCRDTRSLCKLLADGAKKRGCSLSSNAAAYLIDQVGNGLQTLLNELEKLCSYADGSEITKEMIDKIAVKSLSAKVFDMSKALVRRDYETAYSILNNLFALREEPVPILAAVSTAYVDMYRAKCAKISGAQAMDVTKHFNYRGREFRISNASRDCDKLSAEQLRASVEVLAKADVQLKSSSLDGRLILEEAMVKLLLIAKGSLL